jgi:predicted N-acetyltransferase YhbS
VEGAEVFDLERDLRGYEAHRTTGAGSQDSVDGTDCRQCQESDLPSLETFLRREFPGRWTYDTLAKVEAEGRCEFVQGLFVEGRLEGFAITQDASHRMPIGGAVWRNDLGPNWGSLGPIGISKSGRGKGLGDALLASALLDLKSRAVRRCIIDWTTLGDFYGRHGFLPTRRYRTMSLGLL